jgi:SAM-dependent methyltransferase
MNKKEKNISNLKSAYETRTGPNQNNYSWFQSDVCLYRQERDRVMLGLLKRAGISDFSKLDIFEVGCGFGDNLLNLIKLGATPERISGSDIINSRVESARYRLPQAVNLFTEDSSEKSFKKKGGSFDLVIQFTVFSSILLDQMQVELANNLMHFLRKDGYILWYDFLYRNPRNASVRGCSKRRVLELFPDAEIFFKKVTLAPPLCRSIVRYFPFMYPVLNVFPFLRTHMFALIKKN